MSRRRMLRKLRCVVEDQKLSLAAKGVFAYIATHRRGWNLAKVADHTRTPFKHVYEAWRELVRKGYLEVKKASPSS